MINLSSSYYYVYVLLSEKDGKKYTGYTKNLSLRFEAHNSGKVPSTKNRRPLKLIYFKGCLSQDDALRREKYLKNVLRENVFGKSPQILFHRTRK